MTSNARNQKQNASDPGIDNTGVRSGNPGPISAEQTEKNRRWLAENADAIHAENEYIEKHGLPLAKYRLF